jgi:hypothetical protein
MIDNIAVREQLIRAARDQFDRPDIDGPADLQNVDSEYLRGVIELVANVTQPVNTDLDEPYNAIQARIVGPAITNADTLYWKGLGLSEVQELRAAIIAENHPHLRDGDVIILLLQQKA